MLRISVFLSSFFGKTGSVKSTEKGTEKADNAGKSVIISIGVLKESKNTQSIESENNATSCVIFENCKASKEEVSQNVEEENSKTKGVILNISTLKGTGEEDAQNDELKTYSYSVILKLNGEG